MLNARSLGAAAGAAVLALAVGASPAPAQTPEQFYRGKTVTVLIGHPPGGSYDLYAQLVARHYGRFIPGGPTVIVQHMPGGGGSVAAAHFANRAERDGTVVAIIPESLAHTQLLEPDRARWDIREMRYAGSLSDVVSVMAARKESPVRSAADLRAREANFSCSGRTTSSAQSGAVANFFVGAKLNVVCGYDSATASILAVFRGEADLTTTVWANWNANYAQQLRDGEIKPVLQFGGRRLPDLPDVPTAVELVEDPKHRQALMFFAAGQQIGRAILTPPGVPDARFQALAAAFDAMVRDPAFLEDARSKEIPINPTGAAEMKEIVDGIFSTPREVIALLDEGMAKGFER